MFLGWAKRFMRGNKLLKNSLFLMASAGVQAVLGFGFWLFLAHLYTPSQIGLASALLAVTAILVNVSMFGVNSGLVRFLANAKDQSRYINAAIIIVGIATITATTIYILGSQLLGYPVPLLTEWWQKILLIIVMPTITINSLTDAVFIANRRAEFHTAGYGALGLVKLLLPLGLVALGAMGIVISYIGAVIVSLFLSLILMRYTCDYRLRAKPDWTFLTQIKKYATHNYMGAILGGLPSQVMPVLILQNLTSDDVAYFSIAWTMVNLIYVIPSAVSQSMLAESSYDIQKKMEHMRDAIKVITLSLLPVTLIAVTIAPYLLEIFGHKYAIFSTILFQVLALTSLSVAVNEVFGSFWNVEHKTSRTVVAQLCNTIVTIGSALYLLQFGLIGAGLALMLGYLAATLSHFVFFVSTSLKTHS